MRYGKPDYDAGVITGVIGKDAISGNIRRPYQLYNRAQNPYGSSGLPVVRLSWQIPQGFRYYVKGIRSFGSAFGDVDAPNSQADPAKIVLVYESNGEQANDERIPANLWGAPGNSSDMTGNNIERVLPIGRFVQIGKLIPNRDAVIIDVYFSTTNFPNDYIDVMVIGELRKAGFGGVRG